MNLESIFFLFFFLNHFISIFFKEGAERKWRFGLGSIFMAHLPTKRNEKKMRTKNIPVRNRTAFDPRVPFGLLPKVQNRNPFSLSLSLSLSGLVWFGLFWVRSLGSLPLIGRRPATNPGADFATAPSYSSWISR